MKAIIFDASTLISFTMNGLLPELRELKKIFKGKFLIPVEVRQEVVDKPLGIKRFELEALKVRSLIEDKVLEMPSSVGIKDEEISFRTKEIIEKSNSLFYGSRGPIHLIDSGEAACLALSEILTSKGIDNVVAVDERTTRMLCEKQENLRKFMEKKLHTKIVVREKEDFCGNVKFIRSIELIYVAWKKGLVRWKDKETLDALLYAMKFKGASVSDEEIKEIKRLR